MAENRMNADRLKAEFGITVETEFVPFSKSRNAKPGAKPSEMSLNWRVTLKRDDRPILTTDYMAGVGHCPSYMQGRRWTLDYAEMITRECETGRDAVQYGQRIENGRIPILPDAAGVVYSLVMDAGAIDSPTYEDWAADYGYDSDSRKGEQIYRACLETGLKLRAALGESKLSQLREEFQDF